MTKRNLYIHGSSKQLNAIKESLVIIAQRVGCTIDDESCMNILLRLIMQVLVGDVSYPGLLIGMNTEDPQC